MLKETAETRIDGRTADQLRPITVRCDVFSNATSSVLLSIGNTQVLCALTLDQGVPHFLRGKGVGWLTAEYSMLPTAGSNRIQRESSAIRKSGRAVEISRLIGRSLRAAVDLSVLGERTIVVDCDVLRADGGTRTACITGAFLALERAQSRWLGSGLLKKAFITHRVAAVSVGLSDTGALLDLNYVEDSTVDVDYNFVLTEHDTIIEIQGTADKHPISWDSLLQLQKLARSGVKQLLEHLAPYQISIDQARPKNVHAVPAKVVRRVKHKRKPKSLFSLSSRGLRST